MHTVVPAVRQREHHLVRPMGDAGLHQWHVHGLSEEQVCSMLAGLRKDHLREVHLDYAVQSL